MGELAADGADGVLGCALGNLLRVIFVLLGVGPAFQPDNASISQRLTRLVCLTLAEIFRLVSGHHHHRLFQLASLHILQAVDV